MDTKYFQFYGGGKKYSEVWKKYTLDFSILLKFFNRLNFNVKSFFDIGAADGSLIKEIRTYGIDAKGIEIYKGIVPKDMRSVIDIADANTYEYPYSDIMYLNSFAYYSPKQLKKLFNRLSCKYIVCVGEFFDTVRYEYPKGIFPDRLYEINLKPYVWWINFFNEIGFKIEIYNYFFILKKEKEILNYNKIEGYFKIKYFKDHITFNSIKMSYKGRKLYIKGASKEDLIQLSYILPSFDNDGIIAIGKYDHVPGWTNKLKGNLEFYSLLY